MPWCPKCKTEYIPGTQKCIKCDINLVEQLDNNIKMEPFATSKKEESASKLAQYLDYSGMDVECNYFKISESWVIYINENSFEEAMKYYKLFKKENKVNDIFLYQNEISNKSISNAYVKKTDKYEDLHSTAYLFTIFGSLMLIFAILNIIGILNIINNTFSSIIMLLIGIVFIYIGINSFINSKKVLSEIDIEKSKTEKYSKWLKENVKKEFIDAINNPLLPDEVNYFNKTDKIKHLLINQFGEIDDAFLDNFVDEFYTENYENKNN